MLNWILSRIRSEDVSHPLGSEKAIAAYLAQVPVLNPGKTLQELGLWLGNPDRLAAELPPTALARAVERLDEFAQPAAVLCLDAYLAQKQQDYAAEQSLRPLETYFHQAALANRLTLDRLLLVFKDPKQRESNRATLANFAVRAMYALVQEKKLTRFTYREMDATWWEAVHQLLYLARDIGIIHYIQPPYPDSPALTSVWREYLAGVFLEVAPVSNLTPLRLEVTDRLIHRVSEHFLFVDSFSPHTPYRIRLDGDQGPERCTPDQPSGPTWRHFGAGAAHAQLIRLRATIQLSKEIPEWLESSHADLLDILDVLQLLIQHWSLTPPRREKERQKVKRPLLVVSGLQTIRRALAATEFAKSGRRLDYEGHIRVLDLQREGGARPSEVPPPPQNPAEVLALLESTGIRSVVEEWDSADVSPGGMGVRFLFRKPWQAIGALVGYRWQDELEWRVAVIRRLGRSHGVPNAGLSLFPGQPLCAQIQLMDQEDDSPWSQQAGDGGKSGLQDAILLSPEHRMLLVPPDTFRPDRRIDLVVGGKRYPVRLAGLQAQGGDYELVLFRGA
ncbi:hypothetical protein [Azospira inquinata]|uniref:Uncharacterized protein n=1 Tax=Azospira inquinata TaxID=2785627 RepID=A0A975SNR0_9RHOO|nr:hypothetical protein [Azospira inquinata]QWT44948.1 hypothetical protein J8L76_08215 [Azospira inquinata]QWT49720.1 hypothetical protein Azoinq_03665 [Azospira inquinata]